MGLKTFKPLLLIILLQERHSPHAKSSDIESQLIKEANCFFKLETPLKKSVGVNLCGDLFVFKPDIPAFSTFFNMGDMYAQLR